MHSIIAAIEYLLNIIECKQVDIPTAPAGRRRSRVFNCNSESDCLRLLSLDSNLFVPYLFLPPQSTDFGIKPVSSRDKKKEG